MSCYPLQCYAGLPMPLKAGKFEVVGYSAAPSAVGTAVEIALIDDETIKAGDSFGKLCADMATYPTTVIVWDKVAAGYTASRDFSEPIKLRHGLSVYTSNVQGGSLCVYVR